MKPYIGLFFLFAMLMACSHQPAQTGLKESYNCDEGSFWVIYSADQKTVTLNINIQSISLKLIPDSPEPEYSDNSMTFWPKGRKNVFVKRNLASLYHNCLKT